MSVICKAFYLKVTSSSLC